MNLFYIMGLISTIALALPIITLVSSKLAWYRSFPALLFYYFFVFSYTVALLGYIDTSHDYRYYHGIICNVLDTPLILAFLTYFGKTIHFRKRLQVIALVFIVFEIIVLGMYGFNTDATTIILAPGLLLTLIISVFFFIHQVKIAVVHHKAVGKAVMISALVFAYVGYCFVYAVYYVIKPAYKDDAHLVYFLITISSCITMAIGIYFERARVRQLEELKTTRKELKSIYAGEADPIKMTTRKEAVILNFDKDRWR